jgi:Heterokaryon incompatibility protein (HET)
MAGKAFIYDKTRPYLTRLFKLDLNGHDEALSGKLMSITNSDSAWSSLELGTFFRSFKEDSEGVIRQLGDGEGYDALSYCWGDSKETYPLAMSTISYKLSASREPTLDYEPSRNGTLQIQQNLHSFLLRLRQKRHNRFIWIDAICIDQNNPLDKDNQIPLMRDIYEYAECVYIWLGEATPVEKGAIQIIPALTEKLLSVSRSARIDPRNPSSFELAGLPPPSHEIWKAFGAIMTRPWWSRLWTLQEVVVAKAEPSAEDHGSSQIAYKAPIAYILCSDTTIPWGTFEAFASALSTLEIEEWVVSGHWGTATDDRHAFDGIKEIRTCRESYFRYGWAVSLSALLLATRRRKATVPVDIVVGQSALLDKRMIKELALQSSQPVERVFLAFGKHYIRQEAKEVLFNHIATQEKLSGLPSWCPNFASPEATLPLGSRWLGHYEEPREHKAQMYHAAFNKRGKWSLPRSRVYYGKYIANALIGRDPLRNLYATNNPRQVQLVEGTDHIRLSGVDVDEVVEVIDCNPAAENLKFLSFDSIQQTNIWDAACLALARRTLLDGVNGYDIYARTLTANRVILYTGVDTDKIFDPHHEVDFIAPYLGLKRFMQATLDAGERIAEEGNLVPEVLRFAKVLERISRRRRFFATRDGRIGLGPSDTRLGDRLAVVFYCPTPYLLRVGNTTSQMVGEAYVHGLMYGEALDMFDAGQVEETKWIVE